MSCHTWVYSCIPEKQEEWKNKIVQGGVSDEEWLLSIYEGETIEDWANTLTDFQNYREKYLFDYWQSPQDKEEYLKCFNGSEEKLIAYCNEYNGYTPERLRDEIINKSKNRVNELKEKGLSYYKEDEYGNYIDGHYQISNRSESFGFFCIHDGKIYKENVLYGDIFRIYDYNAKPCFSYEETLQRIGEYSDTGVTDKVKEQLKLLFDKHPDTIIAFR